MTPRDAAAAVQMLCRDERPELTARPWNRYQPADSAWWLVPSSEWPAYRHAKYFFTYADDARETLDFGLYIEKGLSPSIREVYSSRKGAAYIMDGDWAWNRLLRAGGIERLASAVGDATEPATRLKIDGGYVPDPDSFDPYAEAFEWSTYSFRCVRGGLELADHSDPPGALHVLRTVSGWSELASALSALDENAWLWINVFVLESLPTCGSNEAEAMWDGHLSRFTKWLRNS